METIIRFSQQSYPFDSCEDTPGLKAQTLVHCPSKQHLPASKAKYQQLKAHPAGILTNVLQIYQQDLSLHIIYEYVPLSLGSYLQLWAAKNQERTPREQQDMQHFVLRELDKIFSYLVEQGIETVVKYRNMGISYQELNEEGIGLKYFVGDDFSYVKPQQGGKEELANKYLLQKRHMFDEVLKNMQASKNHSAKKVNLKESSFSVRDDISETKTQKRNQIPSQAPYNKNKPRHREAPRNSAGSGTNKKHKYSCHFEQGSALMQEQRRKRPQENQFYSLSESKSMKIEVEHQQPTAKCRKSSIKLKITTFQEIEIESQPGSPFHTPKQANEPSGRDDGGYRLKVQEAKRKAEAVLHKFMKNRTSQR